MNNQIITIGSWRANPASLDGSHVSRKSHTMTPYFCFNFHAAVVQDGAFKTVSGIIYLMVQAVINHAVIPTNLVGEEIYVDNEHFFHSLNYGKNSDKPDDKKFLIIIHWYYIPSDEVIRHKLEVQQYIQYEKMLYNIKKQEEYNKSMEELIPKGKYNPELVPVLASHYTSKEEQL